MMTIVGCTADEPADWNVLRNQANELYNEQRFSEALALYEQALKQADADGRLTLRQDIIDCHLAMDDDREVRRLLTNLMAEAHDSGDRQAEAEATYTLGEQLYEAGDSEKGFAYAKKAIRLMEQMEAETDKSDSTNSYNVSMTLAYFHQGLMKWYVDNEAYSQAIAHSKAIERVMLPLGNEAQARKFCRVALSTRAYIYMLTDSVGEAESAYRQWQQLQPCLNLTEERDICPYYIESGHYREALEFYGRYEPWVLETKGYWSGTEHLVCYNMAEIFDRMGLADSAYSRLMRAYEIRDTLVARQAEANAQELEAVYQNQQKTEQIQRQRLWILGLSTVLAVVAGAMLTVRLRRLRKRKNRAIVNVAKSIFNTDSTPNPSPTWEGSGSAQQLRFAAFDRTVEQSRLYTQPDLTREMLADLMGVDRTTFSRIIQEQSGCKNMNDYLNQKRIRHAARLLMEHPNHTVHAVMEDSGFQSKSNFIRLFRETYGMTPSEYRNRQE